VFVLPPTPGVRFSVGGFVYLKRRKNEKTQGSSSGSRFLCEQRRTIQFQSVWGSSFGPIFARLGNKGKPGKNGATPKNVGGSFSKVPWGKRNFFWRGKRDSPFEGDLSPINGPNDDTQAIATYGKGMEADTKKKALGFFGKFSRRGDIFREKLFAESFLVELEVLSSWCVPSTSLYALGELGITEKKAPAKGYMAFWAKWRLFQQKGLPGP